MTATGVLAALGWEDPLFAVVGAVACYGIWYLYHLRYEGRPHRDPSLGVAEYMPTVERVFRWTLRPASVIFLLVALVQIIALTIEAAS
jgi:hypothetical protein